MATLRDVLEEALEQGSVYPQATKRQVERFLDELVPLLEGKVLVREHVIKRLENERDFSVIRARHHRDGDDEHPGTWEQAVAAIRSMS